MAKKITKNNSVTVKTTDAKWNAASPAIAKAVDFTVTHATSGTRDFVVGQFALLIDACRVGAMTPKDVDKVYALIATGIKSQGGDSEAYNVNATRNSEAAAVLKLFDWLCCDNLFKALRGAEFVGLTFEKLVRIARYLRGTPKQEAATTKDVATLPAIADIVRAMNKVPGKGGKNKKSTTRKQKTPVGMPMNEADRGLAHVAMCLKAFDKKHGKRLDASAQKLIAAMFDNCTALVPAVKALAKADLVKEAAE